MGRHKYIDTFYLYQTYSYIPKQLIRENTNINVLFKQDVRNLRYKGYVGNTKNRILI